MTLTVLPVTGLPEVQAGDDLAALVLTGLGRVGVDLVAGDVLVVSSKIASKALGLTAPDRQAAIAAETVRVVAERRAVGRLTQVVEARSGPVMAAAGVDASNIGDADSADHVLLLPRDPDDVCRALLAALREASGVDGLGVVLSDTAGRPWRAGQVDIAVGAAGISVVDDLRGGVDADGRELAVTIRAVADEIASAADLVKGKADGVPVALVRGLPGVTVGGSAPGAVGARSLVRTGPGDWFALGHAEAVRAALGVLPGSALAERVGVMDVVPEPVSVRIGRAVAVALHDLESVGVDVGHEQVVVTGPDPVEVGLAAARVAVALWGEGFDARVAGPDDRTDRSVVVTLLPRT